jgi:hypothetical protein
MYEKRCVFSLDGIRTLIEVLEYLSTRASETISTNVLAATLLLTYFVDYINGERRQGTFNTQ